MTYNKDMNEKPMKAPDAQNLIEGLTLYYEGRTELTTGDIKSWCEEVGYTPHTVYNRLSNYKTGRGKFSLASVKAVAQLEETYEAPAYESLVPAVDENFVPFGNFKDVKTNHQIRCILSCLHHWSQWQWQNTLCRTILCSTQTRLCES